MQNGLCLLLWVLGIELRSRASAASVSLNVGLFLPRGRKGSWQRMGVGEVAQWSSRSLSMRHQKRRRLSAKATGLGCSGDWDSPDSMVIWRIPPGRKLPQTPAPRPFQAHGAMGD